MKYGYIIYITVCSINNLKKEISMKTFDVYLHYSMLD